MPTGTENSGNIPLRPHDEKMKKCVSSAVAIGRQE